MDAEGLLLCSQGLITEPYAVPEESSPQLPIFKFTPTSPNFPINIGN
jgi:hypothetical protein